MSKRWTIPRSMENCFRFANISPYLYIASHTALCENSNVLSSSKTLGDEFPRLHCLPEFEAISL
ncbi:MAG: hypothetical protein JWM11_7354 [Planctomycetaceae bacterium]|nr:hypothetical protein [Planctomycetaceae bacterium]